MNWEQISVCFGISRRTLNHHRQQLQIGTLSYTAMSDEALCNVIREILQTTPGSGERYVLSSLQSCNIRIQRWRERQLVGRSVNAMLLWEKFILFNSQIPIRILPIPHREGRNRRVGDLVVAPSLCAEEFERQLFISPLGLSPANHGFPDLTSWCGSGLPGYPLPTQWLQVLYCFYTTNLQFYYLTSKQQSIVLKSQSGCLGISSHSSNQKQLIDSIQSYCCITGN